MSTLGQPHFEPAWKQEVNRRIAAHRNRKGTDPAAEAPKNPHQFGSSRAAEAAARVAARYANAPSYSQMQAEEARVVVRAAEIATQVALEAQAAAEDVLAELHAAVQESPTRGPAVVESILRVARPEALTAPQVPISSAAEEKAAVREIPAVQIEIEPAPRASEAPEPIQESSAEAASPVAIRWEPDLPVRVLERRPVPREEFELAAEDWWTPAQVSATLRNEPIAVDAQPPHANLIEFPRELVATRRMRPRLAEAPVAALGGAEAQLSIFEVDPGAISTEPSANAADASSWAGPEWSGIELDEHPAAEVGLEPEPAAAARILHLAPLGLRLMALVVDSALICGAFFGAALFLTSRMQQLPLGKSAEAVAVAGVVLAGFLYHALFFAFGLSTPGMRYAGIALCNFDDDRPAKTQLRRRLGAMVLSLAPVGLGFAWSIFDEDHLSWHDRISQTYLRKR
ncbi:MAG TPA: RDD family protein [Terracidiphilus sp.]|nr:RDD family protein [Terracidiphilus sp.]